MRCTFLFIGTMALATACGDPGRSGLPTAQDVVPTPGDYVAVDLSILANPNPSGGVAGMAWDINDLGQVVGQTQAADGTSHAFLFNGVMRDLGTLGGDSSVAYDVNELGHVAGRSKNAAGEWRAFLWDGTAMRDLGSAYLRPYLNDNDQAAWTGVTADGSLHAFLWDNGTLRDLGTLGGPSSFVNALGDQGQVIGISRVDSTYRQHGFRWADGVMTDLGRLEPHAINTSGWIVGLSPWADTIPPYPVFATLLHGDSALNLGTLPGHYESSASAVNGRGEIAGISVSSWGGDFYYPFVWQDGVMRALDPAYPSAFHQRVVAINDNGFVIGHRPVNPHAYQATVWAPDGTGQNLGTLGGEGSDATAINEQGVVVGWATTASNNQMRAVLWMPLSIQVVAVR